ncbi:MAG: hypothetical protein FWG44_08255 [Oscillospiraceae bacterium]|nr:hypothetical protein [Oscillospiraceae bacterium]
MDVCNADHADLYFPKRYWEIGKKEFSYAEFEWDKEKRIMLYGGGEFKFGETAEKPKKDLEGDPTRLYKADELSEIFKQRGMETVDTFSDYYGKKGK